MSVVVQADCPRCKHPAAYTAIVAFIDFQSLGRMNFASVEIIGE